MFGVLSDGFTWAEFLHLLLGLNVLAWGHKEVRVRVYRACGVCRVPRVSRVYRVLGFVGL